MFSASYPLLEGPNYGFVEQSEQWWRKKRSTAAHLLQFLISLICAEFDHCRITYIMRHNGGAQICDIWIIVANVVSQDQFRTCQPMVDLPKLTPCRHLLSRVLS